MRRLRRHPSGSARVAVATAVAVAAGLITVLVGSSAHSFAETYGWDRGVVVVLAAVGGAIVGGLLLLVGRLGRLRGPSMAVILVVGLLTGIAASVGGTLIGDQARTRSLEAAATACDGEVGTDLAQLAEASGRVGLQDGSLTRGNSRGECIAEVNARPGDVIAAAHSLGWTVVGPDRVISESAVAILITRSDAALPGSPVVALVARSPSPRKSSRPSP